MVRCGFCKTVFNARIKDDPGTDQQDVASTQKADKPPRIADTAGSRTIEDYTSINGNRHYSTAATTAWSLAILLLIAALAVEYIWFNQVELLQHPRWEPLTSRLCQLTDCERLQRRDASLVEMVSRNVYTHPNEKNALMISTTLVNQADFAQPHPDVQVDFSNVRGKLVASRRFTPEEYMPAVAAQPGLMAAGDTVNFGLEIRDPGKEAITYEFSFH